MDSNKLSTKERNKEFDLIFKQEIVPFLESKGFELVSKGSKRMSKHLANGLSLYLYFEFKTFGSGFYDLSIVYYDEEIGSDEDGVFLAVPVIKKPKLYAKSKNEMLASKNEWLVEMENRVIPYLEAHSTHKQLLSAELRFFTPFKKDECIELMKRKSEMS